MNVRIPTSFVLMAATLLLASITSLQAQVFTQVGADIDGEAAGDWSGSGVSLSQDGSRVAVGAPQNDGSGANAGHVRVFELVGGTWTQVGADINGEAAGDRFGYAVALSANGTRLAVAATNNDGNGTDAGHVRVFQESGGIWTQLGADIDGEAAGDQSGYSVAITPEGDRVAVGAIFNDGTGNESGHVRVFGLNGGAWVQLGADIDGQDQDDWCGASVSFSAQGTRLAVGSQASSDNGTASGQVRVFTFGPGTWTQVGQDINGEAGGDNSGTSVSLSSDGTRVAIGAPGNGGAGLYAGHTRIYAESGGVWSQMGADIDAEDMQNQAGVSVSLSGDGQLLAIGAFANNGNGLLSGQTRVYREVGGVWSQVGSDIDGEAAGDKAGQSVSFSTDGMRFAVGATMNDGGGIDAGHARVYELTAFIGVPEHTDQGQLMVMPVPATDVLYIEVPQAAELHLFNTAGQQVLAQRLSMGRASIDVSTLPPGAYVAELRPHSGDASRFAKVLVE